ncbi:MAG: sigma 54-interacting transcriptional regulator [Acidobacteriota bacterium]|nr:sigma 54-interacting transcriptional regulator [Acidobacteriota bacterium]MDW3228305.1 sigma 54-interacting transcriptional regulator [Acidobacteriota bacterium]
MGGTQTLWDNIFGYEELKNKARMLAGIPDNILIIGESGVGKRLFAEAIHNQSARKDGPFITIEIPFRRRSIDRGRNTDAFELRFPGQHAPVRICIEQSFYKHVE